MITKDVLFLYSSLLEEPTNNLHNYPFSAWRHKISECAGVKSRIMGDVHIILPHRYSQGKCVLLFYSFSSRWNKFSQL